jgi:integrase
VLRYLQFASIAFILLTITKQYIIACYYFSTFIIIYCHLFDKLGFWVTIGAVVEAFGCGSPAKRNLHLAALRGFFDRLVNRHVVILNPAASVKGVKDQVIEGETPKITIDQARTLLASIDTSYVMSLRDRAILATLVYTACRAGAVAKLRVGDFQHEGAQYQVDPPTADSRMPRSDILLANEHIA